MNLKKLFALAALLAVSATAFAGNSSSNAAWFEETVSTAAQDYQTVMQQMQKEDDEQAQKEAERALQLLKNTSRALTMGLWNFDGRRDLDQMTGTDKKIGQLLDKTIPDILNKIKVTSDEVFAELEPLMGNLADLLLKNQTLYPMSEIDKESAVYVTTITSITYADEQGLLLGKVSQILQAEMGSALAQ